MATFDKEHKLFPETIPSLYVLAKERKKKLDYQIYSLYKKRIPNGDFDRQLYVGSLIAREVNNSFLVELDDETRRGPAVHHFYRSYSLLNMKRKDMSTIEFITNTFLQKHWYFGK